MFFNLFFRNFTHGVFSELVYIQPFFWIKKIALLLPSILFFLSYSYTSYILWSQPPYRVAVILNKFVPASPVYT